MENQYDLGIGVRKKWEDNRRTSFVTSNYTLSEAREIINIAHEREKAGTWRGSSMHKDEFYGTPTMSDAIKLIEGGWCDNLEALDRDARCLGVKLVDEYITQLKRKTRKYWDTEGDEYSLERDLAEREKCMLQVIRPKLPLRILPVWVDVSATCGVRASDLAKRACAIYVLLKALQLRGYSLELSAVNSGCAASGEGYQRVILKQAGSTLTPGQLAFWCGHPSSLRRAFFCLAEANTDDMRNTMGVCGGYGYVKSLHKSLWPTKGLYILGFEHRHDTVEDYLRKDILERHKAQLAAL